MTVIEVRKNGKLCDLVFDCPEHAIESDLMSGGPYEDIKVVENPNGFEFIALQAFLNQDHETTH